MQFLLPVLPEANNANSDILPNTHVSNNIHPWPKSSFVRGSSTARTADSNTKDDNYMSVNDSVYGYKSIVLKKTTEEGLKEVIKDGVKSKATATVTYKVSKILPLIQYCTPPNEPILCSMGCNSSLRLLHFCVSVQK